MAKKDEEKYIEFWNEFGIFVKEGIVNAEQEKDKEKLKKLLWVQTTKSDDKFVPLTTYLDRMKPDQEKVFILAADSLEIAKNSPHLDYYHEKDLEVVLFTDPIDSFLLMNMRTFEDHEIYPVDSAEPEIPKEGEEEKESDEEKEEEDEEEKDIVLKRFKDVLGDEVLEVKYSTKLVKNPCRLVSPAGGSSAYQRVMRYWNENIPIPKKTLELNQKHPIIEKLHILIENDEQSELVDLIIQQMLDNNLLEEGTLEDPTNLTKRVTELIQKSLDQF